jgi:hypothetical protein
MVNQGFLLRFLLGYAVAFPVVPLLVATQSLLRYL